VEPLPFVDEHRVPLAAGAEAGWRALVAVLGATGARGGRFARLLGCDPARGSAEFAGRPGETVPGFRVAAAEPGRSLELRGRHRFADYALTFRFDGGELAAITRAAFPGLAGRLYRALVIGSGAHRAVTRRMLRQVARAARRADQSASVPNRNRSQALHQ
jgi:hypothetical protein